MKTKILTTTLLVCCFMVFIAIANSLTGKWAGTISMNGNDIPLTYNLKADSGKITGTAENPQGETPITNGIVKGDSIYFSLNVNGIDVPHNGKYFSEADSISLNINYDGTKLHTTLKRSTN
jgi:hypothetical protein